MAKHKPTTLAGELIGKRVVIEWADADADWHCYELMAVDGAWIKLRGAPSPHGDPWNGEPMWVPAASVAIMEAAE